MSGVINYYPDNAIPVSMKHNYPLLVQISTTKFQEMPSYTEGLAKVTAPCCLKI